MSREPDRSSEADQVMADWARVQTQLLRFRDRFNRPAKTAGGSPSRLRTATRRYGIPVGIVVVVAYIALHNHFDGVDWGDDFALYLRQAKAVTIGNAGEVVAHTRYSVDNSGWHSFSPYAYPWGWPLLMSPFYAWFGLNYEVFKFLEVLALCGFLLALFSIVRRRAGTPPAVLVTLLIAASQMYVGATDSVLSDIPYLGFVGLTLWWLDRCRVRGMLTVDKWMLVSLGLLLAYTFNIRREGVGLVFGLIALHAAILGRMARNAKSLRPLRRIDWQRLLLPYGTAAGAVVAFQLILPTVFLPPREGAGLANISARFKYYQDSLAEHVGLKDIGAHMQLFHNETWARRAIALLLLLAAVGVVARLVHRLEEDVALAAYLCTACFIALVSPYQEPRYLYAITPFLVYFAFQAVPVNARLLDWGAGAVRVAAVIPAVALSGLILLNANDLRHSFDYHQDYHYTVNGPESPAAKEMLATVREKTRGDDVILFFRARAMGFYTDRLAVQGSNLDQLLPRVDWYVMAKGSDYSQTEINDSEAAARGLRKAWENGSWVLWDVPSDPRPATNP